MASSIRFFRLVLTSACLAGCTPTSPQASVSQLRLAPDSASLAVGDKIRFVATVSTSPSGSAYAVTWTTSDATSAVVDSTGLALAMAPSPAVSICATASTGSVSSNVMACATLAVLPAPLCPGPVAQLIPSFDTMHVGDVAQFQIPAAQLSGRSPGRIRWTLDHPATASIDSLTGVVTAVSAGGTNVIATDPLTASPCPHDWHAILIVL